MPCSHQLDGECVLRSSARGSFAESTPSIEWMHDVAVSYQLQSSTFFLAVAVLDCFLSLSPVSL